MFRAIEAPWGPSTYAKITNAVRHFCDFSLCTCKWGNFELVESLEQSHLREFHVTHFFSSPKICARLGTYIEINPLVFANNKKITEGPRITRILGLKNHVTRNSRKWDCSKDSTNAKIPHLRVHKPKLRK